MRSICTSLALVLSLTASPAMGASGDTSPAASKQLTHTVRMGETLSGLAIYYGCSVADLQALNGLPGEVVRQGMQLVVPWPDVRLRTAPRINVSNHRVIVGESLSNIAGHYAADVRSIRLFNRLQSDRIKIGQRLKIPSAGPALKRVTFKTKVKPGDSLRTIAARHEMQQRQLKHYNTGTDWSSLRVGQAVRVFRFERAVPVLPTAGGTPVATKPARAKVPAASAPTTARAKKATAKKASCTCTCHHGKKPKALSAKDKGDFDYQD